MDCEHETIFFYKKMYGKDGKGNPKSWLREAISPTYTWQKPVLYCFKCEKWFDLSVGKETKI
jgi:hypothetical protein